jgi:large subunit ribosomal protein LP1
MPAYTFICKKAGGSWTATRYTTDSGYDNSFIVEATDDYSLQRQLSKQAFEKEPCGAIQSSFSYTSPTTAVAQVCT